MPKSKRAQVVSLTKVKAERKEHKKALVVNIQECLDKFKFAYVVGFENMRTGHFKELRQEMSDSRFFLGKLKVMSIALGADKAEPFRPGLGKVAADLSGQVGLLLTDRSPEDLGAFFAQYAVGDFARSGFEATETVTIPAGRLEYVPHSMAETLRKLGMPVELKKGVVYNTQEYTVCTEGKAITPDQGKLLKVFENQMAVFRVLLLSRWTAATGEYTQLEGVSKFASARKSRGSAGADEELDDMEDD